MNCGLSVWGSWVTDLRLRGWVSKVWGLRVGLRFGVGGLGFRGEGVRVEG